MSTSPFVSVNTGQAKATSDVNPRATRYGLIPIWPEETMPRAFSVWEFPPNRIFPFRPFPGEVVVDMNDKVIASSERLPADQIGDMQVRSQYFVELTELAKLSEDDAAAVASVLLNPESCTKYPFELERNCLSCWLEYLRGGIAAAAIQREFADADPLRSAAMTTAAQLIANFDKALAEARRRNDAAIRAIDDPKNPKNEFYDQDFLNVYHTHNNRPTYKTTTSGADIGTQFAEALSAFQKPAAFDAAALTEMVRAAVEQETSRLRAQLAAARAEKGSVIKESLTTESETQTAGATVKESLTVGSNAIVEAQMVEEAVDKALSESFGEKMKRLKAEKASLND